jgi:lipopolysaccharide transport system permease protein
MAGRSAASTVRYWEMAFMIAQREVVARYRGNLLGAATSIAVPLLFLATYTFVFSSVIPIEIRPEAREGEYAFFLFAGLVGWKLFAETANRASKLFTNQAHYVRKPGFPTSVLALATCLSALFQSMLWVVAFAAARLTIGESLPPSLLAAPFALCVLAAFSFGVSLVVATVGVFVNETAEIIAPLLTLGFFLSPVLYSVERLADIAPWLVVVNPMAPQLELIRGTLLGGEGSSAGVAMAAVAWALGALLVGHLAHARAQSLLADVV